MSVDLTASKTKLPGPTELALVTRVFRAQLLPDGSLLFPLRPVTRSFAVYELLPLPAIVPIILSLDELGLHSPFPTWQVAAPLIVFYLMLIASFIVRRSLVIRPGCLEGTLRQGGLQWVAPVIRAAFSEQETARRPFFDMDDGQFWMRCNWFTRKETRRRALKVLDRIIRLGLPDYDGIDETFVHRRRAVGPKDGKGAFLQALDVTSLSEMTVTFRSAGVWSYPSYIYLAATVLPVLFFTLWSVVGPTGSGAVLTTIEIVGVWILIPLVGVILRMVRPKFVVTAGQGIEVTELAGQQSHPSCDWEFRSNAPDGWSESQMPAHPYLTLHLRDDKYWIIRTNRPHSESTLGDLAMDMNRFLSGSRTGGPTENSAELSEGGPPGGPQHA